MHNRIATDDQILAAVKKHKTQKEAAKSLGMAKQTLKNRLAIMRKKQPEDPRPNTYSHSKKTKRIFVTCAVSGAPLHKDLHKNIALLNADIICIPVQYDWSDVKQGKHKPTYPRELQDCMLRDDIMLNKHLSIMGSVPVHATLANPLSGQKHISRNKSAIFGHPQRSMESVATHKNKLPKLLYTTGAITDPRYTSSATGRRAMDLHTMGGLLIEYSEDRFHVFEITANKDGSFYHLDNFYSSKGKKKHDGVAGVYMADEHYDFYPEEVLNATYLRDNSIVNTLRPEYVVRGDIYNHTCDSHHNKNDIIGKLLIADNDKHLVKDELDGCFDFIRQTSGRWTNVILASNHHDHLTRWLDEYQPLRDDIRNLHFYHQMNAERIERAIETGSKVDAFKLYAELYHSDVFNNCAFLGRDSDFKISGVDCANHGDERINGGRSSVISFSLGGDPKNIGHGHSPRIYRNVRQVGACSMDMGYNYGYSGWMVTHNVIYPDGNQTFIHIIDGEWRL